MFEDVGEPITVEERLVLWGAMLLVAMLVFWFFGGLLLSLRLFLAGGVFGVAAGLCSAAVWYLKRINA